MNIIYQLRLSRLEYHFPGALAKGTGVAECHRVGCHQVSGLKAELVVLKVPRLSDRSHGKRVVTMIVLARVASTLSRASLVIGFISSPRCASTSARIWPSPESCSVTSACVARRCITRCAAPGLSRCYCCWYSSLSQLSMCHIYEYNTTRMDNGLSLGLKKVNGETWSFHAAFGLLGPHLARVSRTFGRCQ